VAKLRVAAGDSVEPGEVIVELRSPELEASLSARRSELERLERESPEVYPAIETLVRANAETGMGAPFPDAVDTGPHEAIAPGIELGPYRVEGPLGSGGMGEVWLARRNDGLFEAPVALKLLHPMLGATAMRDRFIREGRILGQLSHPKIARLLDAGSLPGNRLYLAIEYVQGERIDRWCDRRRLPLRERLRLFRDVCDAVAHAHTRLVVHRDLKPSNILVSEDGAIKLLDFGIAKMIESDTSASAATELTKLHGRALTPEYAAPEQILGAPITVATDVYALGVVLYVLLSGRRPYGRGVVTSAQVERDAIEVDPPPPSTVPQDGEELGPAEIAAQRGETTQSLRARIRGDLDTIVLKALRKAPTERYATVDALSEDVRRYLDDEPVLARPESFRYRARKYVRRHRLAVTAAAAVALSIVAGVVSVVVQSRETARHAQALAQRDAELTQVAAFQSRMLERMDVEQFGAGTLGRQRERIEETLKRSNVPEAERQAKLAAFDELMPLSAPGEVARQTLAIGLLQPSLEEIERFRGAPRIEAAMRHSLAEGYSALGMDAEASEQSRQAIALYEALNDDAGRDAAFEERYALAQTLDHFAEATVFENAVEMLSRDLSARRAADNALLMRVQRLQAIVLQRKGDFPAARKALESLLARQTAARGALDPDVLATKLSLVSVMGDQQDPGARALAEAVVDETQKVFGPSHAQALAARTQLLQILDVLGFPEEALAERRRIFEIRRRVNGDEHVQTLMALSAVGTSLLELRRPEEAEPLVKQAWTGLRLSLGDAHRSTQTAANNYGAILRQLDRAAESLPIAENLVRIRTATLGPEHPRTLFARNNLAMTYAMMGRTAQAIREFRDVVAIQTRVLGPLHGDTLTGRAYLADVLAMDHRRQEARGVLDDLMKDVEAAWGPSDTRVLAQARVYRDHLAQFGSPADVRAFEVRYQLPPASAAAN
jgi:serine/threonine protein kinase/tetratricopeptide (TPR) repeat protein